MSSTQGNPAGESSSVERRRTKRVAVAFQIEVSGREPLGALFNERVTTIDVNEHGCKFDLARHVQTGDMLIIRLLLAGKDNKAALFQIIWSAPSKMGCTVGAMKLQDKAIWPMNFPEPLTVAGS